MNSTKTPLVMAANRWYFSDALRGTAGEDCLATAPLPFYKNKEVHAMKKNQKNVFIRHADPLGRLGVPPDTPMLGGENNVVLLAKLTDSQLNALLEIINDRQDRPIRH